MTKIRCADLRCKYRNGKGFCNCKEINLSSNSIITVWEGRKEFNTCRTMEKSEEYKKLEKDFFEAISKEENK